MSGNSTIFTEQEDWVSLLHLAIMLSMKKRREQRAEPAAISAGQAWRLREFRRRLEYVDKSYHYWKDAEKDRPTFNESLELLRRSFQVPNRKRRRQTRLHPLVEIGISMIASRNQCGSNGRHECSQTAMELAARSLSR